MAETRRKREQQLNAEAAARAQVMYDEQQREQAEQLVETTEATTAPTVTPVVTDFIAFDDASSPAPAPAPSVSNPSPAANTPSPAAVQDKLPNMKLGDIREKLLSQAGTIHSGAVKYSENVETFRINYPNMAGGVVGLGIAGVKYYKYRRARNWLVEKQASAIAKAVELFNATNNTELLEMFKESKGWKDLLEARKKAVDKTLSPTARREAQVAYEEAVQACAKELSSYDFFSKPQIAAAREAMELSSKNLATAQALRAALDGDAAAKAGIASHLTALANNGEHALDALDPAKLQTLASDLKTTDSALEKLIISELDGLSDEMIAKLPKQVNNFIAGKITLDDAKLAGIDPANIASARTKLAEHIKLNGVSGLKELIENDAILKTVTDPTSLIDDITLKYTNVLNGLDDDAWKAFLKGVGVNAADIPAISEDTFRKLNKNFLDNPEAFKSQIDDLLPGADPAKVKNIMDNLRAKGTATLTGDEWKTLLSKEPRNLAVLERSYGEFAVHNTSMRQIDDLVSKLTLSARGVGEFAEFANIADNLRLIQEAQGTGPIAWGGLGKRRVHQLLGDAGVSAIETLRSGPFDAATLRKIEFAQNHPILRKIIPFQEGFMNGLKRGAINAAMVGGILMAVHAVEQGVTDEAQLAEFAKWGEQLAAQSGIPDMGNAFDDGATRKALVEWALANTPAGTEKHTLLLALKDHDYDYGKYLLATDEEIKKQFPTTTDELSQAWQEGEKEVFRDNANAMLFSQLETAYNADPANARDGAGNDGETIGDENSGVSPAGTSSTDGGDTEDSDEQNRDLTDAEKRRLATLQERLNKGEGLSAAEAEEFLNLLKTRSNFLEHKEGRTEAETLEMKKCTQDYLRYTRIRDENNRAIPGTSTPAPGTNTPAPGTNTPAPGTNTPAPGTNTPAPGTNTPPPTIVTPASTTVTPPMVTPRASSGPQSTAPAETPTMLPPEAMIQEPEKENWWSRNLGTILMVMAIIATFGIAYFFIRKYKKKSDKAKDETASLQGQVTNLENQISDLTKEANKNKTNTDTSKSTTSNSDTAQTKTLAQNATQIKDVQTASSAVVNTGKTNAIG